MKFSDKIMTLRKQRGWSQEELANQLDVSRQAIYKWESGLTTPELEKIKKLTEIFDTTFEELLNDNKELSSNKKEAEQLDSQHESTSADAEEKSDSESGACVQEKANETNMTATEQEKKKDLSPMRRGKLLGFIMVGVGALVVIALIFLLILHSCEDGQGEGGSSSSSDDGETSSQNEVVGANCTIQIRTGTSENIQYRVKLTKGQGFKLEIPEITLSCVGFEGYFTEDGTQITNSEGSSLVLWQGEQRYTLYPHYEYKIRTVDDLLALQAFAPVRRADTYSSVKITLENDIDLSKIENWEPLRIYPCFDGQGHTIKNLKSTKGGLFADIYGNDEKYIKNLTLENVNINITEVPNAPDNIYVGTLAGWFQGNVENVTVSSGKIKIASDISRYVLYDEKEKLIVYYAREIENCESNATVEIK